MNTKQKNSSSHTATEKQHSSQISKSSLIIAARLVDYIMGSSTVWAVRACIITFVRHVELLARWTEWSGQLARFIEGVDALDSSFAGGALVLDGGVGSRADSTAGRSNALGGRVFSNQCGHRTCWSLQQASCHLARLQNTDVHYLWNQYQYSWF